MSTSDAHRHFHAHGRDACPHPLCVKDTQDAHGLNKPQPDTTSFRGSVQILVPCTDGRIMVVTNRRYGKFSLPGGKLEPGETPAEAAKRELKEETGLLLDLEQIGGVLHKAQPNDTDQRQWFCMAFRASGTYPPNIIGAGGGPEEGTKPYWTSAHDLKTNGLYKDLDHEWLFKAAGIENLGPRQHTSSEIREQFLRYIWRMIEDCERGDKLVRDRLKGLAFSMLSAIDGGAGGLLGGFRMFPACSAVDPEVLRDEGRNWWPSNSGLTGEDEITYGVMLHEEFGAFDPRK